MKKLSVNGIIKNLALEGALAIVVSLYFYYIYKKILIIDSLFLCGMIFLCIGAFRIVKHMGLFDLTTYGMKKFAGSFREFDELKEKKINSYYDFLKHKNYKKSPWEAILSGIIAILPSMNLLF